MYGLSDGFLASLAQGVPIHAYPPSALHPADEPLAQLVSRFPDTLKSPELISLSQEIERHEKVGGLSTEEIVKKLREALTKFHGHFLAFETKRSANRDSIFMSDYNALFSPLLEVGEGKYAFACRLFAYAILRSTHFHKTREGSSFRLMVKEELLDLFVSLYKEIIEIDYKFFWKDRNKQESLTEKAIKHRWLTLKGAFEVRSWGIATPVIAIQGADIAQMIDYFIWFHEKNKIEQDLNSYLIEELKKAITKEIAYQLLKKNHLKNAEWFMLGSVKSALQNLGQEVSSVNRVDAIEKQYPLFATAILRAFRSQHHGWDLQALHFIRSIGKRLEEATLRPAAHIHAHSNSAFAIFSKGKKVVQFSKEGEDHFQGEDPHILLSHTFVCKSRKKSLWKVDYQENKYVIIFMDRLKSAVVNAQKEQDIAREWQEKRVENVAPPYLVYFPVKYNWVAVAKLACDGRAFCYNRPILSEEKIGASTRARYFYDLLAFLTEVSRGMASIHKHGYLHRDLNLGNVLFIEKDNRLDVWINDFETVCKEGEEGRSLGTLQFYPHEVVEKGEEGLRCKDIKWTQAVDCFSLGALIVEALTLKRNLVETPFYDLTHEVLIETKFAVVKSEVVKAFPGVQPSWVLTCNQVLEVAAQLMDSTPSKRITAKDAYQALANASASYDFV